MDKIIDEMTIFARHPGEGDGVRERRRMATNIAAKTAQRDAIGVEVFANLFKAVVDEMAWVVLRSSHTTFVKQTQDFGVALVTPEGEMFAYPYRSGATPLMGWRWIRSPPRRTGRKATWSSPTIPTRRAGW